MVDPAECVECTAWAREKLEGVDNSEGRDIPDERKGFEFSVEFPETN